MRLIPLAACVLLFASIVSAAELPLNRVAVFNSDGPGQVVTIQSRGAYSKDPSGRDSSGNGDVFEMIRLPNGSWHQGGRSLGGFVQGIMKVNQKMFLATERQVHEITDDELRLAYTLPDQPKRNISCRGLDRADAKLMPWVFPVYRMEKDFEAFAGVITCDTFGADWKLVPYEGKLLGRIGLALPVNDYRIRAGQKEPLLLGGLLLHIRHLDIAVTSRVLFLSEQRAFYDLPHTEFAWLNEGQSGYLIIPAQKR